MQPNPSDSDAQSHREPHHLDAEDRLRRLEMVAAELAFTWAEQLARQALVPLRGVCEQTGVAAVLLRHLNKDGRTSNPLHRGGGSIAFIAAARSALLSAQDPDDPEKLAGGNMLARKALITEAEPRFSEHLFFQSNLGAA